MPPILPAEEHERLLALRGTGLLDTPSEERFDRIVRLAASVFEVPIAYVSLVDAGRQWFKSQVGLTGPRETPREISFCGHAILQEDALIVADATLDDRFARNPLVLGEPHIRFYAGQPLRVLGLKVGTLCLADRQPRGFTETDRARLREFAGLVEHEFQLRDALALQGSLIATQQSLLACQRDLAAEKEKSDRLLLSILPERVAHELKQNGQVEAELHEDVCVMFTDFTGFTQIAERLSPRELVRELNECFSRFDQIAAAHEVERLKTLGDGYLCAAGLSGEAPQPAVNIIRAAVEMRDFIRGRQHAGQPGWDVRIGIHCGPLVAGVVGSSRFAYDVWGDTVNTAARLETTSEPGRINISRPLFDRLDGQAQCEPRGSVFTKSKGWLEMFFVNALA